MRTQASRIATSPSVLESLLRHFAALWRAACAWRGRQQQAALARRSQALLREMSAHELADLGIGRDQVDWFCSGRPR